MEFSFPGVKAPHLAFGPPPQNLNYRGWIVTISVSDRHITGHFGNIMVWDMSTISVARDIYFSTGGYRFIGCV